VAFLYLRLAHWAAVLGSAYAVKSLLAKLRPDSSLIAFLSPLLRFGGESPLPG